MELESKDVEKSYPSKSVVFRMEYVRGRTWGIIKHFNFDQGASFTNGFTLPNIIYLMIVLFSVCINIIPEYVDL
jgi:hypothetical protein